MNHLDTYGATSGASPSPSDPSYLFVTDTDTNDFLSFRWNPVSDEETLVLTTVASDGTGGLMPINLQIPRSVENSFSLSPIDEFGSVTIETEGKQARNLRVRYESRPGPSSKDETISGTLEHAQDGREFRFVVVSDPVETVVAIVGIAVVGCAISIGITAMTADCSKQCTESCGPLGIETCETDITYVLSWSALRDLNFGCKYTCKIKCQS